MSSITDKDKKDWIKFIDSKDPVKNKDNIKNQEFHINSKSIDLHGYTLDEANKKIFEFIEKCFHEGVRKINIVTGKGSRSKNKEDPFKSQDLAILKYSIPNYIQNNQELMKKIIKIDTDSVNSPLAGSFDIFLKKN